MIRVLYVSPFSFKVSGADESLALVVKYLPKTPSSNPTSAYKAIETHVLCPASSPYRRRFCEAGATVHTWPLLRLKRTLNPLYWLAYTLVLPIEILSIAYLLKRQHIDLVHVNMESSLGPMLAARLCQLPLVVHYRGKTLDQPAWFFDRFLALLSCLAHVIIGISHASAAGFSKRHLATNQLHVMHNFVDISQLRQQQDRAFFTRLSPEFANKTMITLIGRWDPQKRIEDFIKAAHLLQVQHPDWRFVVVGGDPDILQERDHYQYLLKLQKRLCPQPPVYLIGKQSNIAAILQSSHVLVLPSIDEGFGRVVIEALAVKCRVVAANSGALPEILQQGRWGWLAKPYNPEDLAATIEKASQQPPFPHWHQQVSDYVDRSFGPEAYLAQLLSIYHNLCSDQSEWHPRKIGDGSRAC